jgi:DNA helicase HerA-like ATPase
VFEDDPHLLRIRLNIGMTGFGKSALLKFQLSRIQKLNGRYILIDPTNDTFHFEKFGRLATAHQVAQLLGPRTLKHFELRVVTKNLKVFEYLCWEAERQGNCFLVVDEIWNFCDTKGGTKMQPAIFDELATEGRHYGVRILGTCHRPTQIHNNLLKLSQEVNVFRTEDLDGLKRKLITKENQIQALGLDRFQFLSCKNARVSLCEVPRR